jgi:y4mF family transcriptional regulator
MKSQKLIYSLCCPFTNKVHYIGKSTEGMRRPMQHLNKSHSEKIRDWVDELKKLSYAPIVNILEYVSFEEDLDGRESYWIQKEINKGSLLLNTFLVTPILISQDLETMINGKVGDEYLRIGKFIKEKRKQVNCTQEEFASKCGVALTVIRKIEQGKSNLQLDGLLQVLKMFGCTLEVSRINTNV